MKISSVSIDCCCSYMWVFYIFPKFSVKDESVVDFKFIVQRVWIEKDGFFFSWPVSPDFSWSPFDWNSGEFSIDTEGSPGVYVCVPSNPVDDAVHTQTGRYTFICNYYMTSTGSRVSHRPQNTNRSRVSNAHRQHSYVQPHLNNTATSGNTLQGAYRRLQQALANQERLAHNMIRKYRGNFTSVANNDNDKILNAMIKVRNAYLNIIQRTSPQ